MNPFLDKFMKQQMTLIHEAPVKAKHGTASGAPAFGSDDGESKMREILSKKKSKKFVLEYYRERIKELCDEGF
jgi:hypothetical protein